MLDGEKKAWCGGECALVPFLVHLCTICIASLVRFVRVSVILCVCACRCKRRTCVGVRVKGASVEEEEGKEEEGGRCGRGGEVGERRRQRRRGEL